MIEIPMESPDLARIRFAYSPIRELTASLRVIGDASRHYMYRTWLSGVGGQLGGLGLDQLVALAGTSADAVGFISPGPTGVWRSLAEELDLVAATPVAVVRTELEGHHRGRPLPVGLRPLYEDPATHLPRVVADMAEYWRRAIEPVWPRLRALCMTDVSHRAEQFASGGVARVLSALHPSTSFVDGRLVVASLSRDHSRVQLCDRGLVLVPCVFAWPSLTVCVPGRSGPVNGSRGLHQPSLIYPPRGIANLWLEDSNEPTLDALIGRTRATLLISLGLPASTTQLAQQLSLSTAAVSQHLKVLKASGLASAHRRGKVVLYQRTTAATALLWAAQAR
jgi:DNA-binding transcriptional ArsR family regulator